MVMLSDSESHPTQAASVAVGDVREREATPPAPTEEPSERADSLSMFSSEGTASKETDLLPPDPADLAARAGTSPGAPQSDPRGPAQTIAGTQHSRYRGGHPVPVAIVDDRATREAIWKLETYVETVSTLQALCASIDKRLMHAEETLARTEGFVADRTLHDLSTRIASRLTETEDAVRHIERVVASGPPEELLALQTLCANIDKRLAQAEETLGRTERLIADPALHDLSTRIASRLTETEDAVRHIERVVASGPPEELLALQTLCANIDKRLAQAEETLGRTERLIADPALHDLSTRIASRLTETEDAVRHIERVVASGPPEELLALQTLCANIDKRLAQAEETLGRTEGLAADRTLHELSARIAARLTDTEDAVRRLEGLVASGALAELSARVETGFAQTDDALRRIEAALDRRSGAPSIDRSAVAREGTRQVVSTATDRQRRPAEVASAPAQQSRTPGLSNPSLLVRVLPGAQHVKPIAATVILLGVLIVVAPMRVPIRVAVPPPPRAEQQPAVPVVDREPQVQAPPGEPAPPTSLSTEQPTPKASAPAPRRRVAVQTTAEAITPSATPTRFVGDLSITSTPPGARVFVNGRAVGVTPLVLHEQRAGSVAVQIASEGFERWSASVQIPAGQVTRVAATLRASPPQ